MIVITRFEDSISDLILYVYIHLRSFLQKGFLTGINTEIFMPPLLFREKIPSTFTSSSSTTSFSAFIIRPINPKEFQGCSNDLAHHLTCSTVIDHQRITKENKRERKRKTTLKLKILTMMRSSLEEGTQQYMFAKKIMSTVTI